MKCKVIFFSLFVLFALSTQLQATVIKHIYEVSVPVVSQEKQVRRAAFEKGLVDVSVRVSGSSLTPGQLNLKQATRLIRQYRYKTMNQAEIEAYMETSGSLVAPKFKLWMQFDDAKVKQLLRAKALPVWGYQRPNVLVWLAVKDGKSRYLLKKSDESQIKDAIDSEATRRGLPLIWPEFDVEDKLHVGFADVWGEFLEPINQASKRYPVDAVLLGRMNWVNGGWNVDWSLIVDEQTERWTLAALDLNVLMSNGVDVATDYISSRFAVFANRENDGELLLRVSGLENVSQYAKASHYLSSLAPVNNVYVMEVNQYQIDFHIELSGDESDLKRLIALGKMLVPDTRIESREVLLPIQEQAPTVIDSMGNQIEVINPNVNKMDENIESTILRYRLNG